MEISLPTHLLKDCSQGHFHSKLENNFGELTLVDFIVIQDDEHFVPEVFYEIAEPRFFVASDNSLEWYSEHQRENWALSKRIIIYENETQLRDFIKNAKRENLSDRKMYFGMVPKNLAERIKKETGIEVEGYNISISESQIRKIFISHGNEETEMPRGQRSITESDIVNIPKIIQNPDKIVLSGKSYEGKSAIKFVKTIEGRTTVVSYVSDKHQDLRVQTMYSGKKK